MSKYTAKGLPWGSGIGVDISDCHTSREVMEKAKLNFTVEKCDLVAKMPFSLNGNNKVNEIAGEFVRDGHIYRDCPNAFGTYRTDMNLPLGLVKCKYEVVQNIDAFNFFDDAIGKDKAVWDKAGCFGWGHKIFVSAKLPIETTVGGDKIDNYLVFSNSHDGSTSVNILFSPIRVFCTNMLNSALHSADSYIRFRHTQRVKEKIQRGAEILKIACEHAETAQQLYNALLQIRVSDEKVMDYISNLVLTPAEQEAVRNYNPKYGISKLFARDFGIMEEAKISTRKVNILVNMFDYYQNGVAQEHIVGTAWGAYNAITGYYSNVDNAEGIKRMDSLLYGSKSNKIKETADILLTRDFGNQHNQFSFIRN